MNGVLLVIIKGRTLRSQIDSKGAVRSKRFRLTTEAQRTRRRHGETWHPDEGFFDIDTDIDFEVLLAVDGLNHGGGENRVGGARLSCPRVPLILVDSVDLRHSRALAQDPHRRHGLGDLGEPRLDQAGRRPRPASLAPPAATRAEADPRGAPAGVAACRTRTSPRPRGWRPAGARVHGDRLPVVSLRSTTGYKLKCLRHLSVPSVPLWLIHPADNRIAVESHRPVRKH